MEREHSPMDAAFEEQQKQNAEDEAIKEKFPEAYAQLQSAKENKDEADRVAREAAKEQAAQDAQDLAEAKRRINALTTESSLEEVEQAMDDLRKFEGNDPKA